MHILISKKQYSALVSNAKVFIKFIAREDLQKYAKTCKFRDEF